MSKHREGGARPRYGRISVATLSSTVTMVAVLGGTGLLPSPTVASASDVRMPVASAPADAGSAEGESTDTGQTDTGSTDTGKLEPATTADRAESQAADALPKGSGSGYRVVFSESQQRVWLVERGREVRRTYLVSGSIYDNLEPGTYSVYSRSEQAWGIDDSGSMKWFVRFAQGDTGAAIGFHDIPIDDGTPVQTVDQLGTPLSHGCIRQRTADAKALWTFAPIGTKVVVIA